MLISNYKIFYNIFSYFRGHMKAYKDDNRFFNLRSDVYFKHFFSVKKMLAIFLSNLWNQNVNEADITYDNTESTVLDGKKIIYD